MRRRLLLLTLIFGVASLARPAFPAEAEHEQLLRFFDDVVFAAKPGGRIVKWTRAPSVRLETAERDAATGETLIVPNNPRLYAALAERIGVIAEVSGLNIRLLPDGLGSGGDIVISLVPVTMFSSLAFDGVPERLLREQTGPGRCFFLIWPNADRSIAKARIVINSLLSENHVKHCFYEETVQSLGLPNDSDRLRPSIFNEQLMEQELSELDRRLIRALYDPRMKPGLDRREALERAATILNRNRPVP